MNNPKNPKNKMYDAFNDVFLKMYILTDAYSFFYNTYEQNHGDYTSKENAQICNLLRIFDRYSEEIRADISNINEQIMAEY